MTASYSFCHSCGARYESARWPRVCSACNRRHFRNPTPVAVLLQPVRLAGAPRDGLLVVRRADPPHAGKLALPGGFVEFGETWRAGAAREVFEEAGVTVDADGIEAFGIESANEGIVLLFGLARPIDGAALPDFVANDEISERVILESPTDLAFPLHTAMAARWFAEAQGETREGAEHRPD